MDFAAIFAWIVANGGTILAIGTSIIGTAALISAVTPNKSDDKIVQFFLDALNFLGANFGKAKNKQ